MSWKFIEKWGIRAGGIKGLLSLGGSIIIPIGTFLSGIYENIGLTASIVLTAFSFTIGVWLVIGVLKLIEILFPPKHPIPLLDAINKSQKYGWRILEDNLDILDLLDALRAAGRRGDIIFEGKKTGHTSLDSLTINQPSVNIPQEHWDNFWIDWSHLYKRDGTKILGFNGDNFQIQSYEIGKRYGNGYKDLHIKVDNLGKWLRTAKKKFQGRRQKQAKDREKQWEDLEKEYEQVL